MECFTADFLRVFSKTVKIWLLGVQLGTRHQIQGFAFQGALSALRQFLETETPLKRMKNAFYFTLKALFVLKMSKFLS